MSADDRPVVATVAELWRYPVKSLQGIREDTVTFDPVGVVGDRAHGFVDPTSGHLLSAKRHAKMLQAFATDTAVTLPDGTVVTHQAPDADDRFSAWLGRPVELRRPGGAVSYEMTFEPPNDDADYYAIPAPPDTFLDLAGAHLISTATLDRGRTERPDLDWDVRRFRPNLLVDGVADGFGEDQWCGRALHVGTAVLSANQPTVRCAMPLRAQPARDGGVALDRQPTLFKAMDELHANHVGIYLDVLTPGTVTVGDEIRLGNPL